METGENPAAERGCQLSISQARKHLVLPRRAGAASIVNIGRANRAAPSVGKALLKGDLRPHDRVGAGMPSRRRIVPDGPDTVQRIGLRGGERGT
jgi:hypothetical protein